MTATPQNNEETVTVTPSQRNVTPATLGFAMVVTLALTLLSTGGFASHRSHIGTGAAANSTALAKK